MKRFFVMIAGLLLTVAVTAGPQERGKGEAVCEKQQQQCMKQCDKEKTAWFFKGEAYDNCASKCEARHASCMATGNEKADDMAPDVRGQRKDAQAKKARAATRGERGPQDEAGQANEADDADEVDDAEADKSADDAEEGAADEPPPAAAAERRNKDGKGKRDDRMEEDR